jgi:hypothetical protein
VFSTSTAYEIFPNVEMGRLRLMFLQTCESKRFIRQAIIALGALDMTSRASRPQDYTHYASRGYHNNSASHHYQYAITQYARAIKYAQMEKTNDFRIALITSLVILSFEGWVGNHELAIQQIGIGMRLMKEWKERNRGGPTIGYSSSSATSDEEDVLSHVFARLSIQLRPPSRPPQSQPEPAQLPPLSIKLPESFHKMPKAFSSLTEAGIFYSIIVRFAIGFVSQGLPRIARASSLTGAYSVGATSGIIPPEISKAQATLADSLHRWMAAFSPLIRARESQPLEEIKASITLELQMKATYMGTVKSLAQDELIYDEYYDIYQDIVRLSEALLKCSNFSKVPRFTFDSAVIIPLWFTGHKCRDPVLRRKVISLLLDFPRREGVWDSVFAGLVIDCLRGFEEEFIHNGKVPGWARIRTTTFDVDLDRRIVEIKCQQRTSATSEKFVTRQQTLDYYVHRGVTLEQIGAVIAR